MRDYDSPKMTTEAVEDSIRSLDTRDVVFKRATEGGKSFAVSATQLCNSLPNAEKDTSTIKAALLKMFYLKITHY